MQFESMNHTNEIYEDKARSLISWNVIIWDIL